MIGAMDYDEARAAFFAPREGETRPLSWTTPARRLRDAIEPLATVCFWSEPAYAAYEARGLDFLSGYVWGRACSLGEPEAGVVAASFGVFEPDLIASAYDAGRAACSLADVRTARVEGVTNAMRTVLGDPPETLAPTVAALRSAAEAAPGLGRPFFSGLSDLEWPEDPWAQLWHACSLLREHRGDSHLASVVTAGLDGVQANLLTEMWIGWEPQAYTGSRGWSPEAMAAAGAALEGRGLTAGGELTEAGTTLRTHLESATDEAEQSVVDAIGDELDALVEHLEGWAAALVEHGWFPPDPYKRAAG